MTTLFTSMLHPFRYMRLFCLAVTGRPLPPKYVRKLERKARRQGVEVDKLWDRVEVCSGIYGLGIGSSDSAWDEEYERYDGSLELNDEDYI